MVLRTRKPTANSFLGGGGWESNPPAAALKGAQTVLKTAPFTRTDAPPLPCENATNPKWRALRLSRRGALAARAAAPVRLLTRLTRVFGAAIIAANFDRTDNQISRSQETYGRGRSEGSADGDGIRRRTRTLRGERRSFYPDAQRPARQHILLRDDAATRPRDTSGEDGRKRQRHHHHGRGREVLLRGRGYKDAFGGDAGLQILLLPARQRNALAVRADAEARRRGDKRPLCRRRFGSRARSRHTRRAQGRGANGSARSYARSAAGHGRNTEACADGRQVARD